MAVNVYCKGNARAIRGSKIIFALVSHNNKAARCSLVGIWNWEWFKNEEFDQLHIDAMTSEDTEERAKLYTKMMLLMNESDAFVWLAYEPSAVMYSNKIKPAFLPDSSTISRWDLFK